MQFFKKTNTQILSIGTPFYAFNRITRNLRNKLRRRWHARGNPGYCEDHAGLEKQAFLISAKRLYIKVDDDPSNNEAVPGKALAIALKMR